MFFSLLLFSHSVISDSCNPLNCIAHQVPWSMGFPRQEYWSRLPFPFPCSTLKYFSKILKVDPEEVEPSENLQAGGGAEGQPAKRGVKPGGGLQGRRRVKVSCITNRCLGQSPGPPASSSPTLHHPHLSTLCPPAFSRHHMSDYWKCRFLCPISTFMRLGPRSLLFDKFPQSFPHMFKIDPVPGDNLTSGYFVIWE